MKASKQTKNSKVGKIIFSILHFLALFGPFLYFIPYVFITGEIVSKITIGLSIVIALILAGVGLLLDASRRGGLTKSIMWVLIMALLTGLAHVKTFIFIMAGTSILDELIFCPLKNKFKTKFIANKEIDKRIKEN